MGRILTLDSLNQGLLMRSSIDAQYRLQVRKAESGVLCRDTGWFNNLITDLGLSYWVLFKSVSYYADYKSLFMYCVVGTGSAAPAYTDVGLAAYLATASNSGAPASTFVPAAGGEPAYTEFTQTYQFGTGAAAGNLTEVGVYSTGGTNQQLFSRSLIQDGSGNPTAITVLSDEILTVTYKVRLKYDSADHPFTVNLNGSAITGTYRNQIGATDTFPYGWDTHGYNGTPNNVNVYSGDMTAAVTGGTPTGYLGGAGDLYGYNRVNDIHNSGTIYQDFTATLGVNTGNGVIKTIVCQAGFTKYIFGNLSTPITKTAGQQLQISFRDIVSRYTP